MQHKARSRCVTPTYPCGSPGLGCERRADADSIRMGNVGRFVLQFLRKPRDRSVAFIPRSRTSHFSWWTTDTSQSPTLTGWVTGAKAHLLFSLTKPEREAHVVQCAADALGIEEKHLTEALAGFHGHDWSADPFSFGAYSWIPVGGGTASRRMAEPVDGTLYFAGEHTDLNFQWGTVHGALLSGYRAADQIRSATQSSEKEQPTHPYIKTAKKSFSATVTTVVIKKSNNASQRAQG